MKFLNFLKNRKKVKNTIPGESKDPEKFKEFLRYLYGIRSFVNSSLKKDQLSLEKNILPKIDYFGIPRSFKSAKTYIFKYKSDTVYASYGFTGNLAQFSYYLALNNIKNSVTFEELGDFDYDDYSTIFQIQAVLKEIYTTCNMLYDNLS